MILKDIVNKVCERIQEKTSDMEELVRDWIYDAKVDMMRFHKFECMKVDHTITGTGVAEYLLPNNFGEILDVSCAGTPIPNHYSNVANTSYYQVISGLTIGKKLKFVSAAAGDTAPKIVAFEDENASENVTLNGTTAQQTARTFATLRFLYKDATAGLVSVMDEDDTVLLTLPLEKCNWLVQVLKLNAIVAALTEIDLVYSKKIQRFTSDYSLDDLQICWSDLIIKYCMFRGFQWQDNDMKANGEYALYNAELQKAVREDNINKNRNIALAWKPTGRI